MSDIYHCARCGRITQNYPFGCRDNHCPLKKTVANDVRFSIKVIIVGVALFAFWAFLSLPYNEDMAAQNRFREQQRLLNEERENKEKQAKYNAESQIYYERMRREQQLVEEKFDSEEAERAEIKRQNMSHKLRCGVKPRPGC